MNEISLSLIQDPKIPLIFTWFPIVKPHHTRTNTALHSSPPTPLYKRTSDTEGQQKPLYWVSSGPTFIQSGFQTQINHFELWPGASHFTFQSEFCVCMRTAYGEYDIVHINPWTPVTLGEVPTVLLLFCLLPQSFLTHLSPYFPGW